MEGILEGLLYVQGDNGLTLKEVMSILNLTEEDAKNLVYKLKVGYEEEDRGLRLNFLGNTFKLTTKKEHKEYYQKLLENYGYEKEACELAEKTVLMFGRDIEKYGKMHEYYDGDSCEGVHNLGFQSWNLLAINMYRYLQQL